MAHNIIQHISGELPAPINSGNQHSPETLPESLSAPALGMSGKFLYCPVRTFASLFVNNGFWLNHWHAEMSKVLQVSSFTGIDAKHSARLAHDAASELQKTEATG